MDKNQLLQRYSALREERSYWEKDWLKLATHFSPTRCRLEEDGNEASRSKLRGGLLDSTGYYAMRDLSAGLHGGLTSPARPWFRLAIRSNSSASTVAVKEWLEEVNEQMRAAFHRSGFYKAVHTLYTEIASFGTGFMFCLADEKTDLRFIPLTAGEYCLDVDEHGKVDTVFRDIWLSLRQIIRSFPKEAIPEHLIQSYEKSSANWNTRYKVVHGVFPRSDRNESSPHALHMPFASVYFMPEYSKSQGELCILAEGGFKYFPGFGVRWEVGANEIYGKSPAMDTLPDSVLLQQMVSSMLQAMHKEINPPMVAPEGMENISLLPGAANFVSSLHSSSNQIYPAVQIRHNIEATMRAIDRVREQVRKGLFNDLFRMLLNSDRRQITASEVAAREEEKLLLIGPTLERLHDELFNPLIDLSFYMLLDAGKLPEPPEELAGEELQVEYMSVLAQAQKMIATSTLEQFTAFVSQAGAVFPELFDAIDPDRVVDKYADYIGLETSILRGKEQRSKLREQRAGEAEQAKELASLASLAQNAKKLGFSPLQSD